MASLGLGLMLRDGIDSRIMCIFESNNKVMFRQILCLIIAVLTNSSVIYAEGLAPRLSPAAQMSILVASPSSNEVYTYYGHAGLRVSDPEQGIDITFNYGIFSFTDDFLYRFVEGRTDYMVMPQYTADYMNEYLGRGSTVVELLLRLDALEQSRAWDYLLNNIKPENREYRYQFFRDNCATRPLYIVEMAVGGLAYPSEEGKPRSWRAEINDLERSSPWLVLGTDLSLGSPTDKPMSMRDKAFSPRHLKEILSGASKQDGSPILSDVREYKPSAEPVSVDAESFISQPLVLFSLLLMLTLYMYGYRVIARGGTIRLVWDALLFAVAGLGGSVLFYISVLSEHQFVSPNYNLWILHPFYLVVPLGLIAVQRLRNWVVCYHFANFVAICAFLLLAYFLPQHFNLALYPIAITYAVVSLARIVEYRRSVQVGHGA